MNLRGFFAWLECYVIPSLSHDNELLLTKSVSPVILRCAQDDSLAPFQPLLSNLVGKNHHRGATGRL